MITITFNDYEEALSKLTDMPMYVICCFSLIMDIIKAALYLSLVL